MNNGAAIAPVFGASCAILLLSILEENDEDNDPDSGVENAALALALLYREQQNLPGRGHMAYGDVPRNRNIPLFNNTIVAWLDNSFQMLISNLNDSARV